MNLHHDTITVHGRTDECQQLIKNKQWCVRTGASSLERISKGVYRQAPVAYKEYARGYTNGRQQLRENMQGGVRTVRHGGMEEQV